MMTFALILLIILGVLLFAFILTTIFTISLSDYKEYKKTYRELPNLKFVKNFTHVYDSEDRGFVWFSDRDDFKMIDCFEVYLHNDIWIKVFNLYGEYWRRKYVKWFKENVNIEELDIYSSHKQPVSKEEYDLIIKHIINHLR